MPTPEPEQEQQLEAAIWALIPCAGSGSRAGTVVPKQYQPVAGRALVLYTLDAFAAVSRVRHTLVLVAPDDHFLDRYRPAAPTSWTGVQCGGSTRAATVSNGLLALIRHGAVESDWVLVHDAARCLISPELIGRLIDACVADPVGGLLAHPVSDTLKFSQAGAPDRRVHATLDRAEHWLAQTPQMFRLGTLRAALAAAGPRVTDEAGAIEAMGLAPRLVIGSALNLKVTFPEDFALAHALLSGRQRKPPTDMDYDYP